MHGVRQWSATTRFPGSYRGSLGELQLPRGSAPSFRGAVDPYGRRGVQETRGTPVPGRRLVQEGPFEEPRRRHRVGDREPVQRCVPSRHLDDTDGPDDQVPGTGQGLGDLDRHCSGAARAEELQQPEGDRVWSAEQPGVQAGEMLAVHAQGEARAVQGAGEDLLGGEQRVDAEGATDQGGHRQVRGHCR